MNEGYKTLQKPLSRALYLLELSGFPLTESGVAVEPEFLANIMEINEERMWIIARQKITKISTRTIL